MNQSCRPGLRAAIQHWAGRQRKAQGPLRLHLSPMGCKWSTGLWIRVVREALARILLKGGFRPSFLTSRMQTCSNSSKARSKGAPRKAVGFAPTRGVYVCVCPRRCPPAEAPLREQ